MQNGNGTYRDGEVIAASKFSDFSYVTERCAHDNGLVAVLLVVVEDAVHALHARIFMSRIVLLHGGLIPVENAADERRDEECTSFGAGDGLDEGKHEREVAINFVVPLQNLGSLDALPGGGDLDQDTILRDTPLFVELCGYLVNALDKPRFGSHTSMMCNAFSTDF